MGIITVLNYELLIIYKLKRQRISRDEMKNGCIMNKRERIKTVFLYGIFSNIKIGVE